MASILLSVLTSHESTKQRLCEVSRIYDIVVLISEDFARRAAVKQSFFSNAGPSLAASLRIAREKIDDTKSISRVVPCYVIPSGGSSWWSRAIRLQPDCRLEEAFNENYVALLQEALRVEASSSSSSSSASSASSDPVCETVRRLQANRSKSALLIDGTDAGLLAALWEEASRKSSRTDVYMTTSFRPREGLSMSRVRTDFGRLCGTYSSVVWENLLFCLPMVGSVGLPPLLMLQYYYRDNTVLFLMDLLREVSVSIMVEKDSGPCLRLQAFLPIIQRLAEAEESNIKAIYARCSKDSSSSQNRVLVDVSATQWKQFRQFYYMEQESELRAEDVRKRAVSYIGGLMQLYGVYRGKVEKKYFETEISMCDAPLAVDLLAVLQEMAKKTELITLPTGEYSHERGSGVRTLNRMYPWYTARPKRE